VSSTAAGPPASPWRRWHRLVLGVGWALGSVTVFAAWWGSSGEPRFDDQLRWVGLSSVGVMFAGAAAGLWLLSGRRAVGIRFFHTVPVLEVGEANAAELWTVNGASDRAPSERLVATDSMRYFHRTACALAQGKTVRSADRAEHEQRGLRPCGVCRP
jgi:hypothetical protein